MEQNSLYVLYVVDNAGKNRIGNSHDFLVRVPDDWLCDLSQSLLLIYPMNFDVLTVFSGSVNLTITLPWEPGWENDIILIKWLGCALTCGYPWDSKAWTVLVSLFISLCTCLILSDKHPPPARQRSDVQI